MNKKSIIYLTFIGLLALLFSCKKDETKMVISASPIAPTFTTVPDLTLLRANAANVLTFVGTAVNPGFQASATYFLEACASGNNFVESVVLLSDIQDLSMKITVSDLNAKFLSKFPADQVSAIDLRIKSVLTIDAGTGYTPMVYSSDKKTVNVTIYGLPRLDLIGSGLTQKIESPLGDGKYSGYVKLDQTKAFTLKNPDTNISYGGTGNVLSTGGAALSSVASGWHKVTVDVNAHTYTIAPFMVGLIGGFNSWGTPDSKLDYVSQTGTWRIVVALTAGDIKFRLNDDWAWNLGGTPSSLTHNGSNYTVAADGNYTITLTITNAVTGSETGYFTIVKN